MIETSPVSLMKILLYRFDPITSVFWQNRFLVVYQVLLSGDSMKPSHMLMGSCQFHCVTTPAHTKYMGGHEYDSVASYIYNEKVWSHNGIHVQIAKSIEIGCESSTPVSEWTLTIIRTNVVRGVTMVIFKMAFFVRLWTIAHHIIKSCLHYKGTKQM